MTSIKAYKDLTDFPAQSYLQINNSGIEHNKGPAYHVFRPKGRKDYLLLYVAGGYVEFEMDGQMIRIEAGQSVFCPPGAKQLIYYPSDPALVLLHVHFTGASAEQAVQELASDRITLCTVQDHTIYEILFRQMIQTFLPYKARFGRRPYSAPRTNGLLLQLLDLFLQSLSEEPDASRDAITAATLYIGEHFREDIDLEQCALNAHLSLSRFSHLFTEKTGISPHKFVLSLRIDKAKELLKYSSLSISEISEVVGFMDSSYFSRLFRKYTGISPLEYRNKARTGQGQAKTKDS